MEQDGVDKSRDNNSKLRKIVYYILGILEALLAFRLIFKILGANPESTFVSLIYNISGAFVSPFNSIFRTALTKGIETKSVLEPSTVIDMIVYALIVFGVVRLIKILETTKNKEIQ